MKRQAQKAATRTRLLSAARAEFARVGFSKAKLRDIAAAAEVSVGSVFSHFASKEELLAEVQFSGFDKIEASMQVVIDPDLTLRPQLAALVGAAIATELDDLDNVLSRISASYQWTQDYDLRYRTETIRMFKPVAEAFERAIRRGEISPDADVEASIETIFTVYLRAFRRARYMPDQTVETITDHVMRAVDILIAGLRTPARLSASG
jgi:TetR/AcrR family transcriptional regulator, cholesterol catabolism regulator